MQPKEAFEFNDTEFEQLLEQLDKGKLLEFRKAFREFSFQFRQNPPLYLAKQDKEKLRIISKKLHFIKKECEQRELREKFHNKTQQLLSSPSDALQMEDLDFKETIQHMNSQDFASYLSLFEQKYLRILNNRESIIKNTNQISLIELRENLAIIRRWDLMENEIKKLKTKQLLI